MARFLAAVAPALVAAVTITGCSALDLATFAGVTVAEGRRAAGAPALTGPASAAPAVTSPTPEASSPSPTAVGPVPMAEVDGEALLAELQAARDALGSLHIEMTLQQGADQVRGSLSFDIDQSDPKRRLWAVDSRFGADHFKGVQDRGTLYVTFPGVNERWLAVADGAMEPVPELLLQYGQPCSECRGRVQEAIFVGETTHEGVAVRQYELTVSAQALSEEAGPDDWPLTYTLYVDEQSRLRRMEVVSSVWEEYRSVLIGGFDEPVKVVVPKKQGTLTRDGWRR